jgi:hypothetical protein
VNSFPRCAVTVLLLLAGLARSGTAQNWQSTVTTAPPGSIAPLRPLRATYRFGWSGMTAATADVHLTRPDANRAVVEAKGRTVDMVRTLWSFDAEHTAIADATTLRPIEVKQSESVRSKKVLTTLAFDAQGVTAKRSEPGKAAPKVRRFDIPNLFDLQSALLYLRSQPLANGNVNRIVVFPGKDPYLVTLTVEDREKITVPPGSYDAIKLDLKLDKIGKNNELKPHKKFRKATVWLSDDADRTLLRAEAEVFIGTVFAELQSVEFEAPATRRD